MRYCAAVFLVSIYLSYLVWSFTARRLLSKGPFTLVQKPQLRGHKRLFLSGAAVLKVLDFV